MRATKILFAIAAVAAAASDASAQSPDLGQAIKLTPLWSMGLGSDQTSTTSPSERDQHPFIATYYIAAGNAYVDGTPIEDSVPIYRLVTGSEHFDSTIQGEGGATTEGVIGYAFSNADRPGVAPLFREYNTTPGSSSFGDHASIPDVLGEINPSFKPYHPESFLGRAYPRVPGTDQIFESVAASGVIVRSNLAVGCSVWEWWWNGVQFINDYDYGRQMQSSVYHGASSLGEAGDYVGPSGGVTNPDLKHPSPCASHVVASAVETTSAIPLDFNANSVGGDQKISVI